MTEEWRRPYTDLEAQRKADLATIRDLLAEGLTTRQIAERLGVMESYAARLVATLERRGQATLICGRWLPRVGS